MAFQGPSQNDSAWNRSIGVGVGFGVGVEQDATGLLPFWPDWCVDVAWLPEATTCLFSRPCIKRQEAGRNLPVFVKPPF